MKFPVKYSHFALLGIGIIFLLLFSACRRDKTEPYHVNYVVLKWHKSYNDDSFEKSIIGLNWALSHLGAKYTIQTSAISYNHETITVIPAQLGLSDNGKSTLEQLHKRIAESPSYIENGFIDVGHYVSLMIGASEHYYAMTELPKTLSELENQYAFLPDLAYLTNSEISVQHRIVRFTAQNHFHQLFISEEIDSITGEILEYETLDLMQNGQPRFGVFDANGNRMVGAAPSLATAGKPGKCMWCHESSIQPLFGPQAAQTGFMNPTLFADTLIHFRYAHKADQNALSNGVDYQNGTEHVLMELLYITYMEPSAKRLALEWNMKESEVVNLLAGLPLHENEEFSFLGMLYDRKDVESSAPITTLPVSSNVREAVGVEVNYLD